MYCMQISTYLSSKKVKNMARYMDINIDEDSVWTYKNIQMEKLELCEKNVDKEQEWVKGEL